MTVSELTRAIIDHIGSLEDETNVVLEDADGGLIAVTGVSFIQVDPNGDFYITLETER